MTLPSGDRNPTIATSAARERELTTIGRRGGPSSGRKWARAWQRPRGRPTRVKAALNFLSLAVDRELGQHGEFELARTFQLVAGGVALPLAAGGSRPERCGAIWRSPRQQLRAAFRFRGRDSGKSPLPPPGLRSSRLLLAPAHLGSVCPSGGAVHEPSTLGSHPLPAQSRRGRRALVEAARPAALLRGALCGLAGQLRQSSIDSRGPWEW